MIYVHCLESFDLIRLPLWIFEIQIKNQVQIKVQIEVQIKRWYFDSLAKSFLWIPLSIHKFSPEFLHKLPVNLSW